MNNVYLEIGLLFFLPALVTMFFLLFFNRGPRTKKLKEATISFFTSVFTVLMCIVFLRTIFGTENNQQLEMLLFGVLAGATVAAIMHMVHAIYLKYEQPKKRKPLRMRKRKIT